MKLTNAEVEALYQEVRALVRPGVPTAEDALHDAFVDLLEGKINSDDVMCRMRQRISAESRQNRRRAVPKFAASLDEDYERGPRAGEIAGFPYSPLKEATWS